MFSRRERLAPTRFDTSALVASIEPMLSRVIGGEVQLAFNLETRPMPVLADPVQLEQVLLNLVINARDAMPTGGQLTVRTSIGTAVLPGDSAPVRAATLEVTDTGEGMDEETLRRIFEPFFTTKAGRGTGLGLTTALSIVRGSGGTLTAESRVGQGTIIRVSLPLASNASEPAVAEAAVPSAPDEPKPVGHERLLVIDDEPAVREIARRHLVSLGYEVVVADGAASALSAARAADFDLVLTDVVMPEVRGPELATHLRAGDPNLRVVFMTGYAEVDPYAAAPGDVRGRVLGKPFDRAQIGGFVRSALDDVDATAGMST
jgi:two-component system cell cycle sensor histidine kinase/response regulator CckA